MATKKKMLQAAAGNAGGAGLDVAEVFSTYLYEGNGSTQTITNGIDLSGEGGLVWAKSRDAVTDHVLVDSERAINSILSSNSTGAAVTAITNSITSFNSNGFSLGADDNDWVNKSNSDYASWTFRKAPKFFDVVTYTGTGSHPRNVSHNLGSAPGMILVKNLGDGTEDWIVYHRGVDSSAPEDYGIFLNLTDSRVNNDAYWGDTAPTSTTFTVGGNITNQSGENFVAYLFAHNDGDGEFGPDGDQDIIKCGSYTGNGSTNGPEIDLGFEPQWVMLKSSSHAGNWFLFDNMRGITSGGPDEILYPDDSSAAAGAYDCIDLQPNGFKLTYAGSPINASGGTYIYMAIRRGPLAPPESATDVFEVFETTNTGTASTIGSMGPSDFILNKRTDAAATWRALDRLRGGSMLRTDSTDTETSSGFLEWDKMGGVFVTAAGAPYITNDAQAHWMWKRAPGFCDVVAYTGDGVAGRTVSHNLGVAPEMMWVKSRSAAESWAVYHAGITNPEQNYLYLNESSALNPNANTIKYWNNTNPTDSVFTVGIEDRVNGSAKTYIAYLFATLPGVSKVGSYTGTGNDINIDCGFTSGARFVLIKNINQPEHWILFDSVRGITSSTSDPYLLLSLDHSEKTSTAVDIDPFSSGFKVAGNGTQINGVGDTHIFYAIA